MYVWMDGQADRQTRLDKYAQGHHPRTHPNRQRQPRHQIDSKTDQTENRYANTTQEGRRADRQTDQNRPDTQIRTYTYIHTYPYTYTYTVIYRNPSALSFPNT